MNIKRRLFLFHRRVADPDEGGIMPACARIALSVPSWAYGTASKLRNALYDRGLLRAHGVDAPVISVGNITAGGTGKTPLVAWMVRLLAIHKMRPAVLSRGYGADAETGLDDENEMLSRKMGDGALQVDPNRVRGAAAAVANGADVLVLDDGFQHRRLARDLDVVLIDATQPFGGDWMLPRGLLREPLCGLRRAQFLVITRANLVPKRELKAVRERLEELAPDTPRVECGLELSALRPLADAAPRDADALREGKWMAFCGIGNPDGFRRTLAEAGCRPAFFRAFADHEPYSRDHVEGLLAAARKEGCRGVLCTEKDAVKVERLLDPGEGPPVYAAVTELDFGKGRAEFVAAIVRAIGRTAGCAPA